MLVGLVAEDMVNGKVDSRAVDPSAYHITHEGNLDELFRKGYLLCDSVVRKLGIKHIPIGYKHTKNNRLVSMIPIAQDLSTGDCVPFNYSPRSVMLNVIYYANHPDLETREGEDPVVHLRFNVKRVWDWAKTSSLRAFITNANAAAAHAEVFDDVRALQLLHWDAIETWKWKGGSIRTDKAAELLVENCVSLDLLEEIGVKDAVHHKFVNDILFKHPKYGNVPVSIHPEWYYGGGR